MPLQAHGDSHEKIRHLNHLLRATPHTAALHIERGRLHLEAGHLRRAEQDFRTARQLDPSHTGALYFLAETQLQAQNPAAAERTAFAFLAALSSHESTGHFLGYRLLARIQLSTQRYADAAAAYQVALSLHAGEPDDHLALASALLAAGNPVAALSALDQAITRLGHHPGFWQRAVDIELARGDKRAALLRLDTWITQLAQPAAQLARKGALHRELNEPALARAAYERALCLLDALPPERKGVPAFAQLASDVRRELALLPVQ